VLTTGLTVVDAAKKLGVDRTTFSRLINDRAGISSEMAIRLSIALGTPSIVWMNLQRDYDLYKAGKNRKKLKVEKITKKAD
jgi:antitoxin HigA-1